MMLFHLLRESDRTLRCFTLTIVLIWQYTPHGILTEYDRDAAVLISSATEPAAYFTIPSVRWSRDAIHSRSRLAYLPGLWCQHAFSSLTNSLTLLRYSEAVTHHSSFAVSLGLPVSQLHWCWLLTKLDFWNATLAGVAVSNESPQ